jgi:PAS domain S-box-containing protein
MASERLARLATEQRRGLHLAYAADHRPPPPGGIERGTRGTVPHDGGAWPRQNRLAGSLIADTDGELLYCAPSLAEQLGCPAESLIGRGLGELLPGASIDRLAAQAGVVTGERAPTFDQSESVIAALLETTSRDWGLPAPPPPPKRLRTASGSVLAVDLVCSAMSVRGARLLVIEVWQRDRASELALARLAQQADRAPGSVLLTDRAGAIEYANPVFEARSGFGRAALIGRNAATLGRDREGARHEAWITARAGRAWHGAFVLRSRGGGVFREEMVVRPYACRGGPAAHFVCAGREAGMESSDEIVR